MKLSEAKEILNKNGYSLNESEYTIFFTDIRDIVRLNGIDNDEFNETIMNMFKTLQTKLEDDIRFKVEVGTQGYNNDEYYGSIVFKISDSYLQLVEYEYNSGISSLIHLKLFDFEPNDYDISITKNGHNERKLVFKKSISAVPHTKTLASVDDIRKIIEKNIKIINSTLVK